MQKLAVITGASRGIGAATALLAARNGYSVVVNYLQNEAAAHALAATIHEAGGRATPVQADVSQEAEVAKLFEAADREPGELDLLVNNAGVVDRQARVQEMHESRLYRMLGVNVVGSFMCAAAAVRRMSTARGGKGGNIVNVSSAASKYGSPNEYVDYAASKAAIDTFTLGLAKEVASEGIRVNAVRPGIISTEIHASGGDPDRALRLGPGLPLGRPGSPEEVARAILWLASDAASYCTGAILDVAGAR